jgi:hypothetical protein
MLLPLTTYALLLCAGVLSLTSLISHPTRLMLAVVGAVQVGLLIKWTVTTDCIGSWCAEKGGLGSWLIGPVLLVAALSVAVTEAARRSRGAAPHRATAPRR